MSRALTDRGVPCLYGNALARDMACIHAEDAEPLPSLDVTPELVRAWEGDVEVARHPLGTPRNVRVEADAHPPARGDRGAVGVLSGAAILLLCVALGTLAFVAWRLLSEGG